MQSSDVKRRVESEIAEVDANTFGWDFRAHLLANPELHEYRDDKGKPWQLWLVLREPEDGYHIVFDPDDGEFGLATGGVVVGWHGTFLTTVNGM
jgi:hypothetical protein